MTSLGPATETGSVSVGLEKAASNPDIVLVLYVGNNLRLNSYSARIQTFPRNVGHQNPLGVNQEFSVHLCLHHILATYTLIRLARNAESQVGEAIWPTVGTEDLERTTKRFCRRRGGAGFDGRRPVGSRGYGDG